VILGFIGIEDIEIVRAEASPTARTARGGDARRAGVRVSVVAGLSPPRPSRNIG
jgi:hypothetical protein